MGIGAHNSSRGDLASDMHRQNMRFQACHDVTIADSMQEKVRQKAVAAKKALEQNMRSVAHFERLLAQRETFLSLMEQGWGSRAPVERENIAAIVSEQAKRSEQVLDMTSLPNLLDTYASNSVSPDELRAEVVKRVDADLQRLNASLKL